MNKLHRHEWLEHLHGRTGHRRHLSVKSITHDERFWPIVAIFALLALMIPLAVWYAVN